MSDFDDLFNFDDDAAAQAPEKKEVKAEEKKSVTQPKSPPSDDLLSDFEFPSEPVKPKVAAKSMPVEDDFFGDTFGSSESPAPQTEALSPTPVQASDDSADDLFADFLNDSKKAPSFSPPQTEALDSSPAREQNIESLFDESSGEELEKSGENTLLKGISSDLASDYQAPKRKLTDIVSPKMMMAVAGTVIILSGSIVGVARFADSGFLGWKLGKRSGDDYSPPSASVLAKLTSEYTLASALFLDDALPSYQDAIAKLDKILQTDPRHFPTLPRMAEALLFESGGSLNQKSRKRIETLLTQSGTFYPDKFETLRAKARLKLVENRLTDADGFVKKARDLNAKDAETLSLMGEIAFKKEQFEQARELFNQSLEIQPDASRTEFFIALLDASANNKVQAEATLKKLTEKTPPHPRSQLELLKLWDQAPEKTAQVRAGLEDIVKNKTAQFSEFELGKAYRYLAEMDERAGQHPNAILQMEESVKKDPLNDDNGFFLGNLYLQSLNYDKAVERLAQVSTIAPGTVRYLTTLARAYRLAGKSEQGIIEVKRAIEVDPNDVESVYELGMNQRVLRRNEEAISSFDLAIQKRPNFPEAMIELSELNLERDGFSAAEVQLKSLLEMQPRNVRALQSLGKIRFIQRKSDEALALLKKAEDIEPENTRVLNQLTEMFLFRYDIPTAAEYVAKAEKLNPASVETHVASAQVWLAKKDYVKASEILDRIIQSNPKNTEARLWLSRVHVAREEYQEGVAECQEGFKYKPESFDLKLQIGVAWRGVGDLEQSINYIKTAIQQRPQSAEAYYQLELSQIFRNDSVSAEQSMDKSLSFDPSFIDPLIAMGDFYKGRSEYDQAAKYYQRAIVIQPKNPKILLALGEMYRNEGSSSQANKYYGLTIQVDPKNTHALLGLGMIAEENKQPAQAATFYERAKQADPMSARPYYYLGLLYKQLGKKNEAIASLKKYLELDPNSKEKDDIKDQIASLSLNR